MDERFSASAAAGMSLSADAVLAGTSAVCGANRVAAAALRAVIGRLISRPGAWPTQAKRMSRVGFSVRYLAARFSDVLELAGDIALVLLPGERFLLMRKRGERWLAIDANGQDVADCSAFTEEMFVEAIALRTPLSWIGNQSPASLASLWPMLRGAWAEIGMASLFVNAGQLLLPLFAMLIYDKVVNNGVFETLWALVIGMLIYLATDSAMRLVRAWAGERIGDDLARIGDETLLGRLMAQVDFSSSSVARFLTHYRDLALSRDFVSSSYLLGIADLPFLALNLFVIGVIAWPLLIVAAVLVLLYAVFGLWLQSRANRLGRESESTNARKLTYMGELLGALDVVRTVPGDGVFFRRWRDLVDRTATTEGARRLAGSHLNTLSSSMQVLSTVAILTVGVYLIEARALSVGGLIACNLLAGRAMGLVASLFGVIGKWKDFQRAAERMEKGLEAPSEKHYIPRPDTRGNIAVIGLGKRYKDRPPALENVSLAAKPGERIALLGRPGAGKTTLLRSLAGLCRTDSGQILVDGLALHDIARVDRARWLAWKSQDPTLFAGSLEDNLRVAMAGRDDSRFARAIWASGLEEELSSGRMTLGMLLTERGGNLSGGQRQKVALARVFAQPCRIMLLDEPTLGLDPDGERQLAERLPQVLGDDALLIMTTHSVTMLGLTQRVIVLDSGRVVADGPRDKLVQLRS